MSLNLALNNAISGMQLNQQSLSVLSQNIANVNTEGYSRQIINQSAVTVDGLGEGVTIDSITRKIDTYLQRAQQTQNGIASSTSVTSDYYERLQVLLGSPGAQNSIDAYLTGFFNSLQSMASAPDSVSSRSILVNSAQTLANQISSLAKAVEDLRFQADKDISANVTIVNASLDKLSQLNGAIRRASGLGQSNAGLLDERDKELKTLTQNLNISVSYDNSGTVIVSAGTGAALVDVSTHHLQYQGAPSAESFYTDNTLNALTIVTIDSNGKQVGTPDTLISGGTSDTIVNHISSGNLSALQNLRDNLLPGILSQLDQLASRLRDTVNEVHNQGSGFPPATSLTGERLVTASDYSDWSGTLRIAAVNSDGTAAAVRYTDEVATGLRPLFLDLATLDSGYGSGKPTVQTLIDEINNHFGAPPTKTELGLLNNIQMVSDTGTLPSGSPPLFNFDFDAENITRAAANMFVTGISVLDDTGANITNVTQGPPSIALSNANTYQTTLGSADVDITLASTTGLSAGQTIYLGSPSAAVILSGIDGIAAADVTGYFTIKSVTGNTITITNSSGTLAATGTSVADASPASLITQYDTIQPGADQRTGTSGGEFQVNFSGASGSAYYDVTVSVGVQDANGIMRTSNITYRVTNGVSNLLNERFDSTTATGAAQRIPPNTTQPTLRAMLVDSTGTEIPKVNGVYLDTPGYLKITSSNSNVCVAVDSLNSAQLGDLAAIPPVASSNLGFSSYFGLNNFFTSNALTETGDSTKGSALKLAVATRIVNDPNLVSTGSLVQQTQPADTSLPPQYTYVRYAGDNTIAQRLAGLNTTTITFDAAGGLPATQVSLQGYAGNFLADLSSKTAAAKDVSDNAKSLLDGFNARATSISGVNLDDELANTVIFQNAYAATARVISVVGKMYDALIEAM